MAQSEGIQLFFSNPPWWFRKKSSIPCVVPGANWAETDGLHGKKWEREEDHLIPLVLGRDDLLLLAYLNLVRCSVGH